MDVYGTGTIDPFFAPKAPPPPQAPELHVATELVPEARVEEPTPVVQDQVILGGGQQADPAYMMNITMFEDLQRKLNQAARGEPVDLTMIDFKPASAKPPKATQAAYDAVIQAGGDPAGLNDSDWDRVNANPGIAEAWKSENGPDWSSAELASRRASDPLVFDLNGDGDTNATVDQHGIEVDGAYDTKWAEQGDGVLAFGDAPLDTEGGKYQDAYANLRDKAVEAGIDVSKGYLDSTDLMVLEARGLTMMVSNGDGTNTSVKPTELGIGKIGLGGQTVDRRDSAGNQITAQGSFTRNGQEGLVQDMWLNQI